MPNKSLPLIFLLIILMSSSCSGDDRYKGKTDEQKAQMYHDAKIKIVMRWTCNELNEEVTAYKKAKLSIVDPYYNYFSRYPRQFIIATTLYKTVIISTLKDHPYKIPPNELDISYIKPFDLSELNCKDIVAEWRIGQANWLNFLKRN